MINQYDYYCPKCDEKLNKNNQVLFNITRMDSSLVQLFLDPKPRSYKYKCKPWVDFEENEVVNFTCPYCDSSLTSEKYPNFIKITLKVTEKVLFDVFFSRIYGDHRTYVGIEDFEEEYGHKITI
jgi:transcription initiation factor IIE alpha subunit